MHRLGDKAFPSAVPTMLRCTAITSD
ncbi:MAG: hypothetical protein JWQ61_1111, partial [Collimonas fungivorans]|nr:hypothetical protein [Collimonas fungivorans]